MISTIRSYFARLLSTEIGVLGGKVADLQAAYDALSEDYSGFKETTTRTLKRIGMRWARSGAGGDGQDLELVMEALRSRTSRQDPFQEM